MSGCAHARPMLALHATSGGYQVEIWADTNPMLAVSQDGWLLSELPGRQLRLAVLDGVTPLSPETWQLGLDQAAWAAQTTRAALHAAAPLAECIGAAHSAIYQEALTPYARPRTGLAALDLRPDGSASLAVVSDCQAWVGRAGSWTDLGASDMLVPEARAAFIELVARKSTLSFDEFINAEAELLADPAMWTRHGVGQFEQVTPLLVEIDAWDELVLATDGALLNEERLQNLPQWLAGLRSWEQEQAAAIERFKASDDLSVIRVHRCG